MYAYIYIYIQIYEHTYIYIYDPFPSSTQQPSPPTFVGPSCPSHGKRRRLLIGESEPVVDGLGRAENVGGALGFKEPPAMPRFLPEIAGPHEGPEN